MHVVAAVVGLWGGFAIAAVRAPATTAVWCAKEGALELVSELVLVAIAIAWASRLARSSRARGLGATMLAFTLAVLGEELDWGTGANVHNVLGGHSYLLFAIVPAVAAIVGCVRPHAATVGPSRAEGIALVVAALPSVLSTAIAPGWASALDEVGELAIYLVLAVWAVRVAARPRQPA